MPWSVNTPPALPLYPYGLIMHHCAGGERKVRPPQTVEETALVGASVGALRLAVWPHAKGYVELLRDVARVERECGCDIPDSQLSALRIIWGTLTADERQIVKAELALLRYIADSGFATCPLVQLDNLNAAPVTAGVGLDVQRLHPPGGG